jgi:hypothetical protein
MAHDVSSNKSEAKIVEPMMNMAEYPIVTAAEAHYFRQLRESGDH